MISAPDIGMVIPDNFKIYHLDESDAERVNVDSICFAEGQRYIIHLIDYRCNRIPTIRNKARAIFENPLMVDTDCPCYLPHFDMAEHAIFTSVEIMPKPLGGDETYLKKLSASIGLSTKRNAVTMAGDSITVQFIVTKAGMLAELKPTSPYKPEYVQILQAIKRNSCIWSVGMQSGLLKVTKQKMTIFYSKDQDGNIWSLDSLAYRRIE